MIRTLILILVIIAISSSVLYACSSGGEGADTTDETLEVSLSAYFYSAGKADAALLTTENGTVLVDAGEKGYGKEIVSYLEGIGRTKIDYLIITHFDKDHVGGAAKVIKSLDISNVLQSNYPKDSDEYSNYLDALSEAPVTPVTVRDTYEFELDGVTFSVDPPAEEEYSHDPSNNSSLILTVKCGSETLLFMGDAENERMAEFINKGLAVDCAFMKIPHHGRWDKNLAGLIEKTNPEYAVITSSDDEPEDDETVDLLTSSGTATYFTKNSPVVLTCDGKSLTLEYDGDTE